MDNEPYQPPPSNGAKTSGLAIASLVFGLIGFCTFGLGGLLGIVLGLIALIQISKSNGALSGNGIAIGGMIASAMSFSMIILAAILFPVFAQARESARFTSCQSNLRQIGVAFIQYNTDYDQRYPASANWCDAIKSKTSSDTIFKCPSIPEEKGGYAFNSALSLAHNSDVYTPAEMALCFDSSPGWNVSGSQNAAMFRHSNRCSLLYCDGHVTGLSQVNISQVMWQLHQPLLRHKPSL